MVNGIQYELILICKAMVYINMLLSPQFPSQSKEQLILPTGEIVQIEQDFTTHRYLNRNYVSSCDHDLFDSPKKPGDFYVTSTSNLVVRFVVTQEHLNEPLGPIYFYYKHLEKVGLVSIRPRLKYLISDGIDSEST